MTTESLEKAKNIYHFMSELHERLDRYENRLTTHLQEISAEINASSQLHEMAEEGIVRRFAEVLEIISAISFKGEGNAPMNAGVELEKVIEVTEDAATKIMDAAESIMQRIENNDDLADPEKRASAMNDVRNQIQEILVACSFQDLTGQRVRKTLENMQLIEERLSTTLSKLGLDVNAHKGQSGNGDVAAKTAETSSQSDIDSLFD